jgi:hypothetical protein
MIVFNKPTEARIMQTVMTAEIAKTETSVVSKRPSPQTVLDIIRQAETNHGFIAITNYRSDAGRVANYILQPYGPDAYIRLVKESLTQLEANAVANPKTIYDEIIDDQTWQEAVREQIESFRITLTEGHGRKDNKEKVDKGFYHIDGIPYVFNVCVVSYHETPEQKAINKALGDSINRIPKSPKAKAKDYLRKNVVLGSYRGQFRLDPEKFDRIAFAHNVIEISVPDFGQLVTPK